MLVLPIERDDNSNGHAMSSFLPAGPMLAGFLAASFFLAVTPGPGVVYIVTRSATQGRSAGLASVAGVTLGNFGNAVVASLGLAAVFAVSEGAFLLVKYIGAIYLIYLGIRTIWPRARAQHAEAMVVRHKGLRRIFVDGFVVALFNPKTSLFYVAFLPQFLPRGATPLHAVALAIVFVMIAAATDTCYACAAGAARSLLVRGDKVRKFGRYTSGGILIGLGLAAALTGPRGRT